MKRLLLLAFTVTISSIVFSQTTKKELEGGIAHGEDWNDWIVDQVTGADVAYAHRALRRRLRRDRPRARPAIPSAPSGRSPC